MPPARPRGAAARPNTGGRRSKAMATPVQPMCYMYVFYKRLNCRCRLCCMLCMIGPTAQTCTPAKQTKNRTARPGTQTKAARPNQRPGCRKAPRFNHMCYVYVFYERLNCRCMLCCMCLEAATPATSQGGPGAQPTPTNQEQVPPYHSVVNTPPRQLRSP